ncbi:accessory gene regulator ArgB-like protein [Phosphitispora sp. TUW77]|uniref:accessory gene regulator ArgB-like protein n=1 Tax=Phosphitispora sp. TUW77 TaxID=3152361 RepID=UPI003AB5F219
MITVHSLAEKAGLYLAERAGKPEQVPILTYGLELVIGETIKLLVFIITAHFLDLLLPMLLLFCTSIPLRVLTGGQHCSSSLRCLVVSLIAYVCLAYLAGYLAALMNVTNLILIAFLASIFLVVTLDKYGPGYSVNYSNSSSDPINTVTKFSFIFLAVWLITIFAVNLIINNQDIYSKIIISTALGIYWQTLMITPLGHKLISAVDKGLCQLGIQ